MARLLQNPQGNLSVADASGAQPTRPTANGTNNYAQSWDNEQLAYTVGSSLYLAPLQ